VPKLEVELFLKTIDKICDTLQLPKHKAEIEERSKQKIDDFIETFN
jgi:hypothetical protein